jgi:hypothetical protein
MQPDTHAAIQSRRRGNGDPGGFGEIRGQEGLTRRAAASIERAERPTLD